LLIGYDLWSTGKIQRATLWASAFLIVLQQVRSPIGRTVPWQSFATWVQNLARSFHFRRSTGNRARQLLWRSVERTGEILHPRGETLPGDGSPDGTAHLLQDDQERAGPERGALNLSRGPQVVADQQ